MLFNNLPTRIFLDSSTLQTLNTYGEFIWEGIEIKESNPIWKVPNGIYNLNALRNIFLVNQRANFEFVVTQNSLLEVAAKGDVDYLQWAYEVLDHWQSMLDAYRENPTNQEDLTRAFKLDTPSFGYLGLGDRKLIKDAVILGCHAFLTMERKLPKNAHHIQQELALLVLTPVHYWDILEPVAKLYF